MFVGYNFLKYFKQSDEHLVCILQAMYAGYVLLTIIEYILAEMQLLVNKQNILNLSNAHKHPSDTSSVVL